MKLTTEQVKKFIPHRKPFLFIDSVESINTQKDEILTSKDLIGTKVKASFEVKDNLIILEGHFPGNPILPGVIQVEMMAQACAFSSIPLVKDNFEKYDIETLLLGVEKTRFRKQVKPGMKLEIITKMLNVRSNIANYECEIYCNSEKISEATIMAKLSIKERSNV